MSRRIGQRGNVFQRNPKPWNPNAPAYGRFWIDVLGKPRKRKTIPLGICRTESIAKQKLREHIDRLGINNNLNLTPGISPATTFREQAEYWMESLKTRRRRPLKPATICVWRNILSNWVLPELGDKPVAEVSNGILREFVDKMVAAGLSAKTIVNYTQVVKLIVASAVDKDGNRLYPREWNHDFIGLPVVSPQHQHRPTITRAEIERILAAAKYRYGVLVALLAGTGVRIGEALGIQVDDLSDDCAVLSIRRSVWNGKPQLPKTANAMRQVDLSAPLAALVHSFRADRKSGYLFSTPAGRPLEPRNVRRALDGVHKLAFHSLRRFRTETLRRANAPEGLIRIWLGHSAISITDLYAGGLRNDVRWRHRWCENVGLGFSLVGLQGPQLESQRVMEKAS